MKVPDEPVQILLVTDDSEIIEWIRGACAGGTAPVELSAAETTDRGWGALLDEEDRPRARLPELVLIDCDAPGVGGIDFLVMLRRTESLSRLPVYVMAATCDHEAVEDAYSAGATGYWFHPVSKTRLEEAIRLARLGRGTT